ncbi:hypothetical protein [Vibrio phage vB_VhaP_PG11]|nr:hypothetical protein [Vibrio phage vB_VhaP_PG11]
MGIVKYLRRKFGLKPRTKLNTLLSYDHPCHEYMLNYLNKPTCDLDYYLFRESMLMDGGLCRTCSLRGNNKLRTLLTLLED